MPVIGLHCSHEPIPPSCLTLLDAGDAAVFAHPCDWEGPTAVAVHNLSGRDAAARPELERDGAVVDLFHEQDHAFQAGAVTLELPPYGAHWFRVRRPGERLLP